jgi:hypothetical protein
MTSMMEMERLVVVDGINRWTERTHICLGLQRACAWRRIGGTKEENEPAMDGLF